MQLSAQSIKALSVHHKMHYSEMPDIAFKTLLRINLSPDYRPLIHAADGEPLSQGFIERTVINGKSAGLSAASYDLRIRHDLVLGPHPVYLFNKMLLASALGDPRASAMAQPFHEELEVMLHEYKEALGNYPPNHALATSVERFAFPANVAGKLADKSSYARVFISAFNTEFDPGFRGHATLELVNHGSEVVEIRAGDPICQMVFNWLDADSDRPYGSAGSSKKYQDQPPEPVGAIYEQPETGARVR
jgi:dCTP deaminase